MDIFDRVEIIHISQTIVRTVLNTIRENIFSCSLLGIYEANSFDRGIRIDVNGSLSTWYVNYAYIGYNARNTVLTVDGNVHSWSASVCYISRCNVSEVSIDLSDVECTERSNALAVSNGRCAGNRSSDGRLRFRKLPIRYRDAAICKNGGRRWLMREWLENSILRKKKKGKKKKQEDTDMRDRNFRVPR